MPAQMKQSTWVSINKVNAVVSNFVKTQIIVLLVLGVLAFINLFYLWSIVNVLQVMSHTLLLNVTIPANLQMFMLSMFEISNFELSKVDRLTEWLFSFSVVKSTAHNFEQANIYSQDFIYYVGFDFYVVVLTFVLMITIKLVTLLYRYKEKGFLMQTMTDYSKNIYFRTFSLKCLTEMYLQIFIGAFLNSYNISFESTGDTLNSLLTVMALLICFNLPLYVFIRVTNQSDRQILETKQFKVEYGVFYAGLYTKRYENLLEPVFFFLRRMGFVLLICLWQSRPLAQVSIICLL